MTNTLYNATICSAAHDVFWRLDLFLFIDSFSACWVRAQIHWSIRRKQLHMLKISRASQLRCAPSYRNSDITALITGNLNKDRNEDIQKASCMHVIPSKRVSHPLDHVLRHNLAPISPRVPYALSSQCHLHRMGTPLVPKAHPKRAWNHPLGTITRMHNVLHESYAHAGETNRLMQHWTKQREPICCLKMQSLSQWRGSQQSKSICATEDTIRPVKAPQIFSLCRSNGLWELSNSSKLINFTSWDGELLSSNEGCVCTHTAHCSGLSAVKSERSTIFNRNRNIHIYVQDLYTPKCTWCAKT